MRKSWIWLGGIFTVLVIAIIAVSFFIDEPLRRHMEQELNKQLQGYTARITVLDFHPLGFSLDLEEVFITQNANPDPPVAHIPVLTASVQWRELLSLRLVADFLLERPVLHINLKQVQEEAKDKVPLEERGWQQALQEIYPLKINEFRIVDGAITYIDKGPFEPLRLSQVNFRAGNIRNIHSNDREYPSDIHLDAIVFDSGTVVIDGNADFLAEPHIGVLAQCDLEKIALEYFKPIISSYNLAIENGTLSGAGKVEYAPKTKIVHLQKATIRGVQLDYIHTAESAKAEKQVAKKVARTGEKKKTASDLIVRADQFSITKSTLGFVNKAADPEYRLFLANTEFDLTNLSTQRTKRPAVGKLTGQFMGSGATAIQTTFRPEAQGANFDLDLRVEGTQMQSLNDLWRAYGKFDVVGGFFSLYTEVDVENGQITGYVKPLFQDMDVYDSQQDRKDHIFSKVYEGIIGGVGKILENQPRDEVATKTDISGKIANPNTDTWQVVFGLIKNAFFNAILPGFDQQGKRTTG